MPTGYYKIGKEIPGDQGPVDLKVLYELAKEMTKESGVLFYINECDLDAEADGYREITLLDGTVLYSSLMKETAEDDELF
jgi:hypothetical protein